MKLTHLESFFKNAIEELSQINGRIYVLNSFITQSKNRIESDPRIGHELITSALALRDITITDDVPNLYLPSDHYKLNKANLGKEVDMILSRECLFQVSQSYEILETYLYNQVAEFIFLNKGLQLFVDYKTNVSNFTSIRKALKGLSDRKNNRHLLAIIRANCDTYIKHESSNLYKIDFREWYEMLSEVRHSITHLRTEVTNEIKAINEKSYSLYFRTIEYDGKQVIYTTFDQCRELLSRIGEFTFFVYKALTEKCFNVVVDFNSIQHFMPDIYSDIPMRNQKKEIDSLKEKEK